MPDEMRIVVDRLKARRAVTLPGYPGSRFVSPGTRVVFLMIAAVFFLTLAASLYFLIRFQPLLALLSFLANRLLLTGWDGFSTKLLQMIAARDQNFLKEGLASGLISLGPVTEQERISSEGVSEKSDERVSVTISLPEKMVPVLVELVKGLGVPHEMIKTVKSPDSSE